MIVLWIFCYLPFNLLFLHVYKIVYNWKWHIVKLYGQIVIRKQKVMLEDVAWKQERYDDVILMN